MEFLVYVYSSSVCSYYCTELTYCYDRISSSNCKNVCTGNSSWTSTFQLTFDVVDYIKTSQRIHVCSS